MPWLIARFAILCRYRFEVKGPNRRRWDPSRSIGRRTGQDATTPKFLVHLTASYDGIRKGMVGSPYSFMKTDEYPLSRAPVFAPSIAAPSSVDSNYGKYFIAVLDRLAVHSVGDDGAHQ